MRQISAAAHGPGLGQTLHCCVGLQWGSCVGLQGSQSLLSSPVPIPKQEMLSQVQTMLEQMGIAENHQVVTARLSCSTHSPAVPLAAIPGVGRSSPADLLTLVSHCPQSRGFPGPCLPLPHCHSPCSHLGKLSRSLGSQGMAEPGAQLRAEAAAQHGHINAGRNMLLCASGFVMEHV